MFFIYFQGLPDLKKSSLNPPEGPPDLICPTLFPNPDCNQANHFFNQVSWKDLEKMSEEKGNLKGLAISFILISLIMSAGIGIVYLVGQSIY